jgi:hypothetical protein
MLRSSRNPRVNLSPKRPLQVAPAVGSTPHACAGGAQRSHCRTPGRTQADRGGSSSLSRLNGPDRHPACRHTERTSCAGQVGYHPCGVEGDLGGGNVKTPALVSAEFAGSAKSSDAGRYPREAETQCVAQVLRFRILLVSHHAEGSDRSLRACRTFRVAAAFFATRDLSSLMIIAAWSKAPCPGSPVEALTIR